jgi:hypothetical protein
MTGRQRTGALLAGLVLLALLAMLVLGLYARHTAEPIPVRHGIVGLVVPGGEIR